MTTSSPHYTPHTHASVHPYVKEDIATAAQVPLCLWLETLLGLSPAGFDQRRNVIRKLDWYHDNEIQTSLRDFCAAARESERYLPLATVVNKILHLSGESPEIDAVFPFDDLKVMRCDPNIIDRLPAHGKLGAQRKPDLVWVRASGVGPDADSPVLTTHIGWSDILTFFELKIKVVNLTSILKAYEKKRAKKAERAVRKQPQVRESFA